jgi:hypothetical protein
MYDEAEALLDEFEAKLLGGLSAAEAAQFGALLQRVCEHSGLDAEVHPGLKAAGGTLFAAAG